MGAGPVPLPAEVARANGIVINHVGSTMARVLQQVKDMGLQVFQAPDARVLGVAGPGSAAMEMAICNIVSPGDRVLHVGTGYFSDRMAEMARRSGAVVDQLVFDPSLPQPAQPVVQALEDGGYDAVLMVHGETSSTIVNHHVQAICQKARSLDCLSIVDAVWRSFCSSKWETVYCPYKSAFWSANWPTFRAADWSAIESTLWSALWPTFWSAFW